MGSCVNKEDGKAVYRPEKIKVPSRSRVPSIQKIVEDGIKQAKRKARRESV
jgi:hypothetical protein